MIDYSPFWKTLENSEENWYTLNHNHHISFSTLSRLKNNKDISMRTVNDLCRILNCDIQDIAMYVPSEDDQIL
ncbi:MAG: helix-turn-helix transcriptional regulator [Lachnospiraceae bacterium]|nr:helix-turn-helix transcriptional regulator [Lachnospiraceae bacterium]